MIFNLLFVHIHMSVFSTSVLSECSVHFVHIKLRKQNSDSNKMMENYF